MARQIVVEIVGDAKKFSGAVDDATAKTSGFKSKLSTVGQGFGLGAGIGAFNLFGDVVSTGIGILGDANTAFQDDQAEQAQLAQALKNNIPNWDGNTSAVEDYAGAQGRLGFTDSEVRDSIAQFVGITHDQTEAINLNNVAQDLARAKNIDLKQAVDIVTKAHEGNGKALKGLGIDITGATDAAGLLDAIQKNTAGSAETWADTNNGKLAASNIAVGEAMEKVGSVVSGVTSAVLPVLVDGLMVVIDWMGKLIDAVKPVVDSIVAQLQPAFETVMGFITGTVVPVLQSVVQTILPPLSAAIGFLGDVVRTVFGFIATYVGAEIEIVKGVINILMGVFDALKPAIGFVGDVVRTVFGFIATYIGAEIEIVKGVIHILEGVFDALKPVIRFVGDVVRTVFGFIATFIGAEVQIVKGVIGILTGIFNALKPVIGFVGDTVRTVFNAIAGIIRTDIAVVTTIIGAVTKVFNGIVTTINGVASGIGDAVGRILGFFSGIAGRVGNATRGMWDGIWTAFRSVLNTIIRGWNSLHFSLPSVDLGPLGHFGGFTIGTPNLPYFHQGGIVPGTPGSDVPAVLQAGERVIPRNGVGAAQVIVNIGTFIGSGRDIDRLADLIAQRARLTG